jgi:phosphoribosyl 1,2-cyclic phosphodiesterase
VRAGGADDLLLEAGVRFRELQEATGYRLTSLDAVLVSHEHADHSKAVLELARAGVDVVATSGTHAAIGTPEHRAVRIAYHERLEIGRWRIVAFPAQHDAAEPAGFVIGHESGGKLLYLSDSGSCPYRFRRLTHVLIEANYSREILDRLAERGQIDAAHRRRLLQHHLSLESALEILLASDLDRVEEIVLIHLSDGNADAQLFRDAVRRATGRPTYVAGHQGGSS